MVLCGGGKAMRRYMLVVRRAGHRITLNSLLPSTSHNRRARNFTTFGYISAKVGGDRTSCDSFWNSYWIFKFFLILNRTLNVSLLVYLQSRLLLNTDSIRVTHITRRIRLKRSSEFGISPIFWLLCFQVRSRICLLWIYGFQAGNGSFNVRWIFCFSFFHYSKQSV